MDGWRLLVSACGRDSTASAPVRPPSRQLSLIVGPLSNGRREEPEAAVTARCRWPSPTALSDSRQVLAA